MQHSKYKIKSGGGTAFAAGTKTSASDVRTQSTESIKNFKSKKVNTLE